MTNKHKHIASIITLFMLLLVLPSCIFLMKGDRHKKESQRSWEGYEKATVISYEVDGCTWMLDLEDGKKLQPAELKPEFQKDRLDVWIKYEIKKGAVGICMAGTMINLVEIELRK